MSLLEALVDECPYDMEPGEYWVVLRELYEGLRVPTVEVTTVLVFKDNQWHVSSIPRRFVPE